MIDASGRCLMFVYGLLQVGMTPPRSATSHWPDRVRGQLYDLGSYPGATGLGTGAGWVEGQTIEIDAAELATIDAFEDTESEEFTRVLVTTEAGHTAWAYEYRGPLPAGQTPRSRWR